MRSIVALSRVRLLDQNTVRRAVPYAGPGFVGPAEAERKVRLSGCQHLIERALEEASTSEPVVVVAEAFDAVFPRQCRLCRARLRETEIVEPEVGRNVRLIVTSKQRPCFRGVR